MHVKNYQEQDLLFFLFSAQPVPDSVPVPISTLRKIGSEITTHLDELADELGVSNAQLTKYKQTNCNSSTVTSDGTVQMLLDWNETVGPNEQRQLLRNALKNAELNRIHGEYVPWE